MGLSTMPDANGTRQRLYDNCKRFVSCPKCGAPSGSMCQARYRPQRFIRGLHRERWLALADLDAVTRLSMLSDPDEKA